MNKNKKILSKKSFDVKIKEKTNKKYQFSNDHKHKLKFKNIFFGKNIISTKEKIIKIKTKTKGTYI